MSDEVTHAETNPVTDLKGGLRGYLYGRGKTLHNPCVYPSRSEEIPIEFVFLIKAGNGFTFIVNHIIFDAVSLDLGYSRPQVHSTFEEKAVN